MSRNQLSAVPFTDSKPHYNILDGLRGIAAILVVCFHLLEAHATNHWDQIVNHGYLAVDFFFVLSGFVIGYAYDDRWKKMSLKDFCKRRLIRLQPMVILGGLIGAALFYLGVGPVSPHVEHTTIGMLLLGTVMSCLLLPLPGSCDIRGWNEMYPLNGPSWSLFYEYIANLLYALVVRRFSNKLLALFVFIFGCMTTHYLLTSSNGDIVGGWALNGHEIYVGLVRLLYPFFAGLLLSRLKLKLPIPHPFLICSLFLILLLIMPRVGGTAIWMNAVYEIACILFFFPLIVIIGSSSEIHSKYKTSFTCHFLGIISYPLYITHYPFIYLYFNYVHGKNQPSTAGLWGWGIIIVIGCVALAYLYFKLYDEPVRRYLTNTFLRGKNKKTI